MRQLLIFLILLAVVLNQLAAVRVCSTFLDYFNPISPNCFNNADSDRNVTEIVRNWGSTAEEYYVTTEDGYQILLVRFYFNITQTTPIVMGHGILMNSKGFVSSFNKTLAYQLAASGFQVFLINYRGTEYSTTAGNLTQADRAYWNYSFHQMGIYDLPKALELVKNLTGEKCLYIGFSMGTTISYIYSSLKSADAQDKLVALVSLAPVATLNNVPSLFGRLAPFWPFIRPIINVIWNGQFLPRNPILGAICGSNPIFMLLCETFLRVPFFGDDYKQLDPLYLPVTYILNMDTIGIDVMTHFAQLIRYGRFQEFNFGSAQNLRVYGNEIPPEYNVTNIRVPVALFLGLNDWLATIQNARLFYYRLQKTSRCGLTEINWRKWDHQDFVGANEINVYLNDIVKSKIKNILQQNCTEN